MTFISFIHDALLLIGYALTIYGAYKIYQPAGYLVAGIILLIAFRPKIAETINKRK